MPWFYVDDGFSDSKPVMDLPGRHRLAACGLWVLAGSWSAKEELDGFVPDSKLKQLGARPALVDALTENGPMLAPLWEQVEGGIQFKSWSKWQKTREELNEKRREAAERQRQSRQRKLKGRNAITSNNDDLSRCDSRVTHSVTEEPVTGDVTRDPHARARRPDPTRPLVETSVGVVAVGSDPAPAHTEPSRFCEAHPAGTRDRCGDCANARILWETWQAAESQKLTAADNAAEESRRRRRDLIDACPHCDDFGRLDDLSPCEHQEVGNA